MDFLSSLFFFFCIVLLMSGGQVSGTKGMEMLRRLYMRIQGALTPF